VAPIKGLIPTPFLEGIVTISPNIVLHLLMVGNFVGADSIEEFISFAKSEPIEINPCTIDSFERSVRSAWLS
jgi:hypothetical protein